MTIGLIDSGIGGLTVLKTLMEKYPNHEYIYYGDTIHMPYGEKKKEEVIKYGNNIIKFLEDMKVNLIILACGTLSSNIEYLKSSCRIIDLITPLKGKLDNYKSIGILATPLSVKTNAFKKSIKTNYKMVSCSKLVPLIESNKYDNIEKVLKSYLKDISNSDALILGCTHYPIIKDYITNIYKGKIITLDEFINIDDYEESKSKLKIYFSKINNRIIENTKKILENDNILIERKCLND